MERFPRFRRGDNRLTISTPVVPNYCANATLGSFSCLTLTSMLRFEPRCHTNSVALAPGLVAGTRGGSSEDKVITLPSNLTITSPVLILSLVLILALAAGLSGSTLDYQHADGWLVCNRYEVGQALYNRTPVDTELNGSRNGRNGSKHRICVAPEGTIPRGVV